MKNVIDLVDMSMKMNLPKSKENILDGVMKFYEFQVYKLYYKSVEKKEGKEIDQFYSEAANRTYDFFNSKNKDELTNTINLLTLYKKQEIKRTYFNGQKRNQKEELPASLANVIKFCKRQN